MTRKQTEAEVMQVRETLAEPTAAQLKWMKARSLEHRIYYTSARKLWCSHCGHAFSVTQVTDTCRCPHCGETFKTEQSARKTYKDNAYCAILTTRGDWQVIRYFCIEAHTYNTAVQGTDYAPSYDVTEVLRKWYNPTAQAHITERIQLKSFPSYCKIPYRTYDWYNKCTPPLKITRSKWAGSAYGENWNAEWFVKSVYPYGAILPYLRKRGLTMKNAAPVALDEYIEKVDNNPWAETLVKMGQYKLANSYLYESRFLTDHSREIKIALRHGFDFESLHKLRDYKDYFEHLQELGMDTDNPKYLCPADFYAEHNRLAGIIQRRREEEQRRRDREREIAERERDKAGKEAMKMRARIYAGLCIMGYGMEIRPLLSAEEYKAEGAAMHHCVGTYVNNTTSLILSARKDGQRVETIELDTRTWKIVQSRAECNGTSPQHNNIISLMRKNIPAIRKMSLAA